MVVYIGCSRAIVEYTRASSMLKINFELVYNYWKRDILKAVVSPSSWDFRKVIQYQFYIRFCWIPRWLILPPSSGGSCHPTRRRRSRDYVNIVAILVRAELELRLRKLVVFKKKKKHKNVIHFKIFYNYILFIPHNHTTINAAKR